MSATAAQTTEAIKMTEADLIARDWTVESVNVVERKEYEYEIDSHARESETRSYACGVINITSEGLRISAGWTANILADSSIDYILTDHEIGNGGYVEFLGCEPVDEDGDELTDELRGHLSDQILSDMRVEWKSAVKAELGIE